MVSVMTWLRPSASLRRSSILGFQPGALLGAFFADVLLESFQRLADGRLGELDRFLLLEIETLQVGFELPGAGLHPSHVGEQNVDLFIVAFHEPFLGLLELAAGQLDEAALRRFQLGVELREPGARVLELRAHFLHRLRFLGEALQVLVHAGGHSVQLAQRRGVDVDRLPHLFEIVGLALELFLKGQDVRQDLPALELRIDVDAQVIELQALVLDEGSQLVLGFIGEPFQFLQAAVFFIEKAEKEYNDDGDGQGGQRKTEDVHSSPPQGMFPNIL